MTISNPRYQFTIFTPCYNSENFIYRVYESLKKQTYRDFEWLVINDASSDNTSNLINSYIKEASFPIQFFDLPENQMLTKNYNMAIKNARGKFFLPAGHDDEFEPEALERFLRVWEKYGADIYSGISCLCKDQWGNLLGDKFPQSPYLSNYFDVVFNKKIRGEKWGFIRTDVMRKYKLPEDIDIYVSEGLLWASMSAEYRTIYINETLRIYYINQPNYQNLSAVNRFKINYAKGIRYYNLQMINQYKKYIQNNTIKIKFFLNFIRMSCNLKIPFLTSLNEINLLSDMFLMILLYPIGAGLSYRDIITKKL